MWKIITRWCMLIPYTIYISCEHVIAVIHLGKKSKLIVHVFEIHLFFFLSQSLWSSIWWSLGICIVGCHQLLSFLETMLIITLNLAYKMTMISTTKYPSIRVSLSHLFLRFANGVTRLWCINFENMCWPGFGGTQKCKWGMGSVPIVESRRWGESVSLCCNWNLVSSSANTSFLKILVFVFIGHVLGTTC